MFIARIAAVGVSLATAACGRISFDGGTDAAQAVDAQSGPELVQRAGNASASASMLSATLPSMPAAGDVLVLVGAGNISPLQTPTGGTSAWTRAAYSTINANIEIWYGVADGTTATITIQASATTGMTLWVGEWVGLAMTNVLDSASAAAGTTSPANAGSITTSSAPDLVIFGSSSFVPNTFGVPTDGTWTAVDTQIGASIQTTWFQIAPTPGVIAPTVTETRHAWDAAIAAFRIAQ